MSHAEILGGGDAFEHPSETDEGELFGVKVRLVISPVDKVVFQLALLRIDVKSTRIGKMLFAFLCKSLLLCQPPVQKQKQMLWCGDTDR